MRWNDIELKRNELHIRQRADRYSKMGALKSEAGERAIAMAPMLANTLREWKLMPRRTRPCLPKWHRPDREPRQYRKPWFDSGAGRCRRCHRRGEARYTGLHSLRHFYASWCINRRVDGGLELPLKVVQARLGHASVQMRRMATVTYFPSGDDGGELAAAEKAFLS